jgi:hypothetical protein
MLASFLLHLHRGGTYAYFYTLPQRRSLWYEVGDDPGIDPARARTNLYFSVHPSTMIPPCNAQGEIVRPEYVRSQLRTIAAINCLYAEYDTKDYGDMAAISAHLDALCVPTPSVLIHSGGGVHAYWLLDAPYLTDTQERIDAAKHMQAAWVGLVGGDVGARDLVRALRVPGSWNYKYEPRRPVAWARAALDCTYPLLALTAHLPVVKVRAVEPVRTVQVGGSIAEFNDRTPVSTLLEQRGYRWVGRRKMLSPYSSTGNPGVTVDEDTNRVFVHHGSDPLHDGYWKRPFDVVRILDHSGDFRRALDAVREGQA